VIVAERSYYEVLEALSIRELPSVNGAQRRTVRQALASAVPPPHKTYPPRSPPAIDPWVAVVDEWLLATKTHRRSSGIPHGGLAAVGRRARRDGVGGDGVA
jgi:hypothetical protein